VHTAPGHGQEDFALGQEYGLDVLCPVDEEAKFSEPFTVEVDEGEEVDLEGMHVLTANAHITEALDHWCRLLNEPNERVTIERYPYGWRSKKPVIFRATTQWFVGMDGQPDPQNDVELENLREGALEAVDDVEWVPSWGRDRIEGMLESRPDWCLSRQRIWGVPITVVYCDDCDAPIVDKGIADHVADMTEEHGADVWFERDVDELVPEGTSCPSCQATSFTKETDILDVWFDSGISWKAVIENKMGAGDV
ncbi:MAG: class I tRNA ligase family protein, partial [Bradymonadaceae bacterium]